MSLSTAGSLKALIEGLGLGVPVTRYSTDDAKTYPRVVIRDGIALTQHAASTPLDPNGPHPFHELAQVDVWQQIRSHPDKTTGVRTRLEDPTLTPRIVAALNGARLQPVGNAQVFACLIVSAPRIPDPDTNIAHDAITVALLRNLI